MSNTIPSNLFHLPAHFRFYASCYLPDYGNETFHLSSTCKNGMNPIQRFKYTVKNGVQIMQ